MIVSSDDLAQGAFMTAPEPNRRLVERMLELHARTYASGAGKRPPDFRSLPDFGSLVDEIRIVETALRCP